MYNTFENSIRFKPVIGIFFLLLTATLPCRAQLDNTIFKDFTQTILTPYLINPAAADTSYSFKIQGNSIDQLGLIKYVNRFYVDADKRIKTSRRNSFHFVGLQASSSRIGQYISKSRLQFRYSWYTQLTNKAALSAGASLGYVNYAFLTTQGGTGGSAFGPDGMLGLHYIRENTVIGIAVQQIFTTVLIPINQSFKLNKLYNIDISQRFRLGQDVKLTTYGVAQFSAQTQLLYTLGLMGEISQHLMVGVNDFSGQKTSFNFGVKHIRVYTGEFMIVTTYSVYNNKVPGLNSTLELFIALQL